MHQKNGKNSLMLILDVGPDWATTSLKNIYFYYRFWRENDLDMLTATSYVAGCSAYNSIEHLWAPISRRLSGVKANPCAEGDDVPPYKLSKETTDEKEILEKECNVFDRITKEIKNDYLGNVTFNEFPLAVHSIRSKHIPDQQKEIGRIQVEHFLSSTLTDIRNGKHNDVANDLKAYFYMQTEESAK